MKKKIILILFVLSSVVLAGIKSSGEKDIDLSEMSSTNPKDVFKGKIKIDYYDDTKMDPAKYSKQQLSYATIEDAINAQMFCFNSLDFQLLEELFKPDEKVFENQNERSQYRQKAGDIFKNNKLVSYTIRFVTHYDNYALTKVTCFYQNNTSSDMFPMFIHQDKRWFRTNDLRSNTLVLYCMNDFNIVKSGNSLTKEEKEKIESDIKKRNDEERSKLVGRDPKEIRGPFKLVDCERTGSKEKMIISSNENGSMLWELPKIEREYLLMYSDISLKVGNLGGVFLSDTVSGKTVAIGIRMEEGKFISTVFEYGKNKITEIQKGAKMKEGPQSLKIEYSMESTKFYIADKLLYEMKGKIIVNSVGFIVSKSTVETKYPLVKYY